MTEELDKAKALVALGDGKPLEGWEAVDQLPGAAEWLRQLRCDVQAWIDDDGLRVNVYSSRYAHHLTFTPPSERIAKGYIGVTHTARRMRAGEEHTRGADGPDGDWSEETWRAVVMGILRMELVPLARSAPNGQPDSRRARRRRMKHKVKLWKHQKK